MKNYHQEEVEVVPNAWSSELSADLLGLIADKLRSLSLPEFIRFGSVCLGWRSFSVENYQHIKLPDKVPVLLIPIPPSLLLTVHKKNISFSQSSSCSLSDDEEEEEEEEEGEALCDDDEEEEEEGEEHKAAEAEESVESEEELKEDKESEKEVELVESVEPEEDKESEKEVESVEDEDDESEEEVVARVVRVRPEKYYNPKEIWQGQDHKQRHRSVRNFYSLSEKMVYHDFPLHVPYSKNIRGSSHGWLVTVEECWEGEDNGEPYLPIRLFNPFRTDNNEIQLPPFTNGSPGNIDAGDRINSSYFLRNAFLSANPSSLSDPTTQLVVLCVYGRYKLAFCRPGDKFWTPLVDLEEYRPIQDIICYNDQFYAILQDGYVFAFVFDATQPLPTPIVTEAFAPPEEDGYPRKGTPRRYLVESGGDLLQVRRNVGWLTLEESLEEIGLPTPIETSNYITRQFLVFKLDSIGQWVEMKTLNDHMLFIGTNSSMSISASNFPGWSRRNSIYYTDDYFEAFNAKPQNGPHDIGVFNLEDGSFERHYEAESKTIMPPPIWIQPML